MHDPRVELNEAALRIQRAKGVDYMIALELAKAEPEGQALVEQIAATFLGPAGAAPAGERKLSDARRLTDDDRDPRAVLAELTEARVRETGRPFEVCLEELKGTPRGRELLDEIAAHRYV